MLTYFILSSLLLLATFLTTKRRRRWWAVLVDGFRFNLLVPMVALLVCGFAFLPFLSPPVMVFQLMLAIGILYHLTAVLPFTFLAKPELERVKGGNPIRLLAANVRMSNRKFGRLVDLLKKQSPDIILLTEVDQGWIDALDEVKKTYPHALLQPQDNTYGMAFFSRLPLAKSSVNFLVEDDVPSFHLELLTDDGKRIQFVGLHPRPPAPKNGVEPKDLELIHAAGMTNWNQLPTVVSGDLNDVGWSEITRQFKRLSGLLDPRIGRGLFNTYNALIPFCRVPIDHFFVSPHFKLVSMKRLPKIGSDHFPVLLEVSLSSSEL